jgi:hypothetical protein
MPRPLSKEDLGVLATIVRAQPRDNPPDEAALDRLARGKMITQRRGRWVATDLGKAEIEKRKAPKPAGDAGVAEG